MNRLLNGQTQSRPRPPQGVLVLAVLLVLVAGGYWLSKSTALRDPAVISAATASAAAGTPPPTDASLEDAENHLRRVQQALIHVQESTHRIDQRINQVSTVLDQNYLRLERQRLDAADALTNSVLRDTSEALDELELTKQSLKTGRK